ncbi:MAG: DinB family protein [Chitinophagales bacterium]|nr:DinB family protein [Chitinophagales bacterium]
MQLLSTFTRKQYQLVKGSRQDLLSYCKTIAPEKFIEQSVLFGRGGSMRSLLVHVNNTYQFWIQQVALGRLATYIAHEEIQTIDDAINMFALVDKLMEEFIQALDSMPEELVYEEDGEKIIIRPFDVYSHVITHEYHHKGQIISLSRHLGYTPIDTDIMK